VCCLEQDFPIAIHNPIVTQEVMSCGVCLIAATELLNKHTHTRQLVSGVNCVAIRDVNDTGELSRALIAVAEDPVRSSAIGARGRRYVERFDPGMVFAARTEALFERTIAMRPAPPLSGDDRAVEPRQPSLTQMALSLMEPDLREACLGAATCESETPEWVAEILSWTRNSRTLAARTPDTVTAAIEVDCAIRSVDGASAALKSGQMNGRDPLFRAGGDWITAESDMLDLCPSPFISARRPADLPAKPEPGVSHLAVFPAGEDRNAVLRLDRDMALFLQQCDGKQSARQIAAGLGMSASADLKGLAERLMALVVEDVLAIPAG
jgi:hypothetical protein